MIESLLARNFPPEIFSVAGAGTYELAYLGLSPTDKDLPPPEADETPTTRKGPVLRKVVAARTGLLSSSDLSNSSHYGAVMRKLREVRATAQPAKPVALVIDEFNRADPSRVFGELLTLLEADKREGMPEERKVWLPYSQKTFSVPQAVSVIGTMNTVDKSLSPVDFAMRRRFRFEYVASSPNLLATNYAGVNLAALLRRINGRLSALLGTGHEIGHAFFLEEKLQDVADRAGWAKLPDVKERTLAYVMRTSVLPTIAEYFHDDWRKVRAVAGETVLNGQTTSLFDAPEVEDAFLDRLPEDYELIDGRVAYYAEWWNPAHATWDAVRSRDFLVALADGA